MIRPMTDFLPHNRYEHFIARGRAAPALRTAVVHSCSPEAILADGALESHEQAMQRLVASLKLPEADLFGDPVERALDVQGSKMGYAKKEARGK